LVTHSAVQGERRPSRKAEIVKRRVSSDQIPLD
jgi:hypothetical protein